MSSKGQSRSLCPFCVGAWFLVGASLPWAYVIEETNIMWSICERQVARENNGDSQKLPISDLWGKAMVASQ
jgi:hypothetical protein